MDANCSLAKAYAVQPFVWTLGGIIGSAMGGFLAQPAIFYPSLFSADGLFGRYPYLLPNLVSVAVVAIAVIQGLFFLEETNVRPGKDINSSDQQEEQSTAVDDDDDDDDNEPSEETTLLRRPLRRTSVPRRAVSSSVSRSRPQFAESSLPLPVEHDFIDLRRSSFGTVHSIRLPDELRPPSTEPPAYEGKTFNFSVMMLVLALLIFSYHQMAAASLLATYLLDGPEAPPGRFDWRGGLGYTVHDVGTYLAVNGALGLLIQAVIFPVFVERVGVWHSFLWMIVVYPLTYILMPFLSALHEPWVSGGIYLSLFMQSFCGMITMPVALILLKDATPSPQVLGRVNGLAMSGACLARTMAPPLAGVIYSVAGSVIAWASCTGVALLGVLQLFWVPRSRIRRDEVIVDNGLTKHLTNESRSERL